MADLDTEPDGYTTGIMLSAFRDHLDHFITTPYIGEQLTSNFSDPQAQLLWMDEDGLIDPTSVDYLPGADRKNDYITFEVKQENIRQGNAVLALKDDTGTIVWSWHIWVTDADLTQHNVKRFPATEEDVVPPVAYELAKVNLGWCDTKVAESYPAQHYYLRFVQDDPNGVTTESIKVNMTAGNSVTIFGNCPYYQGARKDPLIPWNGVSGMLGTKKCYPPKAINEYYPIAGVSAGMGTTIGNTIQNPHIHYSGMYSWAWPVIDNGWNAHGYDGQGSFTTSGSINSSVFGRKTIYDPSPVGYKIPYTTAYPFYEEEAEFRLNENTLVCPDDNDVDQVFPLLGMVTSTGALDKTESECDLYYSYASAYDSRDGKPLRFVGSRRTINENLDTHVPQKIDHGCGMNQALCIRPAVDPYVPAGN